MSLRNKSVCLLLGLFAPLLVQAATCPDGTQCSGATINKILVNWLDGAGPYTVKVRFDSLTGLTCNTFGSSYNEIRLSSTDPAFESKYAMLLTAETTGRQVWFTVSNPIGSSGNADGTAPCLFQMIAI